MPKNVLTDNLSETLNGATAARVEINASTGNLTIARLTGGEQVLASGTLQYLEKQGPPKRARVSSGGQATLTLRAGEPGQSRFRFPWAACKGETDWQIQLNPTVPADIIAHSDGGNVRLDLAGMAVTSISATTGGGNMDIVLPDDAANLKVAARTGAGNVTVDVGNGITGSNIVDASSGAGNVIVRIPGGVPARIHATTGLGKATVAPRFSKTDNNAYQSSDFDSAVNRIEITVKSGAGNVIINTK